MTHVRFLTYAGSHKDKVTWDQSGNLQETSMDGKTTCGFHHGRGHPDDMGVMSLDSMTLERMLKPMRSRTLSQRNNSNRGAVRMVSHDTMISSPPASPDAGNSRQLRRGSCIGVEAG
jgi:hypothetical protein